MIKSTITTILLCNVVAILGKPSLEYLLPTDGRIVGGVEAEEGEIPWQVSIQTKLNSQTCGGAIISPDWIVTAAHCNDLSPTLYQVRAGTLTYASGGTVHNIIEQIAHENYVGVFYRNDIAVWRISPPFIFDNTTISAIKLRAQNTSSPADTITTASGWGTTSFGGNVSPVLLKVDVPIIDFNECDTAYGGTVPPNSICAGNFTNGGIDSCQGDSGGPLFKDGELWGIVSNGNGCALAGYPGIYTDAAMFTDWIKNKTSLTI